MEINSLEDQTSDPTSRDQNIRALKHLNNISENAIYHPLMPSPDPESPTLPPIYPDLIPEQSRSHLGKCQNSSMIRTDHNFDSDENPKNESKKSSDQVVSDRSVSLVNNDGKDLIYEHQFPEFPDSPSAMRKSTTTMESSKENVTDTSDGENDKSVYEAHCSTNFENVSLTLAEGPGNLNFISQRKQSNKLRRLTLDNRHTTDEELLTPDSEISSADSLSESLRSDQVYTSSTLDPDRGEKIVEFSAAEERQRLRQWQRLTMPDNGEERVIDMRVIEPYKRVLSHGGYLKADCNTAIILFAACHLPDRSRLDYVYVMDNLFLYILWTLDRLVTDDYVVVYMHGGASGLPTFGWLKRCYQMVGRKLRKNLNKLYLVHPSLWIKTMLFMAKPFISSKFYRKIYYVRDLHELLHRVPIEVAALPDKVKQFDKEHCNVKRSRTLN